MKTLDTAARSPHSLLSAGSRIATALGAAVLLAAVWVSAGDVSHGTVQARAFAMSGNVRHVTLQTVEIVGRREPASMSATAASAPRDSRFPRTL